MSTTAIHTPVQPEKIRLVYIAGPYTAPTPRLVELNVRAAEDAAYAVAELGAMPVCPHTNLRQMHDPIAAFMYPATLELMRRCDAVLLIEGWEKSTGARSECEEAMRLRLPVFEWLNELAAWLRSPS